MNSWDVFLGWFVIFIPFIASAISIVFTVKAPNERHYGRYVTACLAMGVIFGAITAWQQHRFAKQAEQDRKSAIEVTATRTSKSVADLLKDQISKLENDNKALRDQLNDQSKSLQSIRESDFISGVKPVKVEVQNTPRREFISNGQAEFIKSRLQRLGGSVRIVCIGSERGIEVRCEQIQRLFVGMGWNVQSQRVGLVAGVNIPEGTYITGPEISDKTLGRVFQAFQGADVRLPLVPNAFFGPSSTGSAPPVVIVVQ